MRQRAPGVKWQGFCFRAGMSLERNIDGGASWLKSPVTEKGERLRPMSDVWLNPCYGKKRKLRLFRAELTVGSAAGCDIQVDDPFVCPVHAALKVDEASGAYSVRDLSSRNGTFLNGVRVESAPLPAMGVLRLGRTRLTWSAGEEDGSLEEEGWIAADPAMRELMDGTKRLAGSKLPVLLLGETGTGKDVLARFLHRWGGQPNGPFVAVNGGLTGGSLSESELFGHRRGAFTGADSPRLGALRSASGGTLFLDEIADVPLPTQVKLLRALESGEVKPLGADCAERAEFRLVTATSRNLDRMIREGSFRADLYYRIAGSVVHVPPLRERPRDISAIAARLASERGLLLSDDASRRLCGYSWPGNVRELRACVERAAVSAKGQGAGMILPEHLGSISHGAAPIAQIPRTLAELERECIAAALTRNMWSRKAAARELGIARSTLWDKMKKLGLDSSVTAG